MNPNNLFLLGQICLPERIKTGLTVQLKPLSQKLEGRAVSYTVNSQIEAAPQEVVIPKQNMHNSAFSFGITTFWGASFISDFTVSLGQKIVAYG